MKFYAADQTLPVNSSARDPIDAQIPPWSVPGIVRTKIYGMWSPESTLRVTGGRAIVTSGTAGRSIGLAMVKHNAFQQNVVVAQAIFSGINNLAVPLTLPPAMTGASIVTPQDKLQLVIFITDSAAIFRDLTVQLDSEKIY